MSFNMIIWNNLSVSRIIEINVTQFEQPNSSTEPLSKNNLKTHYSNTTNAKEENVPIKKAGGF